MEKLELVEATQIQSEKFLKLLEKLFGICVHLCLSVADLIMPVTVSIVEDNDKLRETLARVLNRAEGFRCVSQYANAEDALKDLPQIKPDVVLMDINLPGINGVKCVQQLKKILPQIQVMMLTVYEDTENIFNALAAGANGYMLKRTSSRELLEAIQEVHRGGSPMTMHIARKVVQSFQQTAATASATENLSEREQQVLDLLSKGLMYKEIADKLAISYETVHTYIRRIYEKLQVRTRTEAVAKFLRR
ncbi:MAG TPA: response regulator transcription factor [Verrucomicrobiae bacterium]